MTTPRIEEILFRFRLDFPYTYDQVSEDCKETHETFLRKALTEAHQAGIDGAVEILKSKKASQGLVFNLVGRSKLEEAKTANLLNQALNDTIKALQDNK